MKEWWLGLNQREQKLLSVSAVLVLLAAIYWGGWQPLQSKLEQTRQSVNNNRATLNWVKEKGQEVVNLRAQGKGGVQGNNMSLNQLINSTARQHNIVLTRIQPKGEEIQVWAEKVKFSVLLSWLQMLDERYGVRIINIDIAAEDQPGLVSVRRLELGRG